MPRTTSAVLLDTSAVVAILTREAAAYDLLATLLAADLRALPVPCAAEAIIVLHSKLGRDPSSDLQEFYREFAIGLIPFPAEHLTWFSHAFTRYGKGRHPAALNLGDCFTYAIAKFTGLPLLFTGNGFSQTDLALA